MNAVEISRAAAAHDLLAKHYAEIQERYGSGLQPGNDPEMWLPFHAQIRTKALRVAAVGAGALGLKDDLLAGRRTNYTLLKILNRLQPDSLLPLQVAQALCVDPDNFYRIDYSGIDAGLCQIGYGPETRNMVQTAMATTWVKASAESGIRYQYINPRELYAAEKMIAEDGSVRALYASPEAMRSLGQLVVEVQLEAKAIHVDGQRPQSMDQAATAVVTDDRPARAVIERWKTYFYGRPDTYTPRLPTTAEVFPCFDRNRTFFMGQIVPMLESNLLDVGTLVRATMEFSAELESRPHFAWKPEQLVAA
ncbi:MAG TPA: hypothetical protein VMY99_03155 [Nevskiaceae bacterium]|nr:hypothetical protein [Nevskiaceae bacterium]